LQHEPPHVGRYGSWFTATSANTQSRHHVKDPNNINHNYAFSALPLVGFQHPNSAKRRDLRVRHWDDLIGAAGGWSV